MIEEKIKILMEEIDNYDKQIIDRNSRNVKFKGRYCTAINDEQTDELKKIRAKKFRELMGLINIRKGKNRESI